MEVTYKDLYHGYILQDDDTIVISDITHSVNGVHWFLVNMDGGSYSEIFNLLHISNEEKEILAKSTGGCRNCQCAFPEFEDAEHLTLFVKELFKRSPYRVGDIVQITKRTRDRDTYPYSYTREMTEYTGRSFKIKSIEQSHPDLFPSVYWNGDYHKYNLESIEGNGNPYNWHSTMFTRVSQAKDEIDSSTFRGPYYAGDHVYLVFSDTLYRTKCSRHANSWSFDRWKQYYNEHPDYFEQTAPLKDLVTSSDVVLKVRPSVLEVSDEIVNTMTSGSSEPVDSGEIKINSPKTKYKTTIKL